MVLVHLQQSRPCLKRGSPSIKKGWKMSIEDGEKEVDREGTEYYGVRSLGHGVKGASV